MTNILITGISGTGKSSLVEDLVRRGVPAIGTDSHEWSERKSDPEYGDTIGSYRS